MSRQWLVRSLVVLTALLCLGLAGYGGQVLWAKRVGTSQAALDASHQVTDLHIEFHRIDGTEESRSIASEGANAIRLWRNYPRWGKWNWIRGGWFPRRAYYEFLKRETGEDLGNDPDPWEAWFKEHPHLIWDETLNRLVEPKP